jgi:signal transduction histidine kinase/FixJ family two-component response regulator
VAAALVIGESGSFLMNDPSREAGAAAAGGFPAGGEMEGAIGGFDWSETPLGPADGWSPALRMMVRILLANRFPLLLWWGPEYVCIYNDAYRPVLGAKHPWALGQPVSRVWREIWPVLKPLIDTPFHGGPPTWDDDILLEINRHGFVEETHFTIAYSPVPDETAPGGIGGVLATVHEITGKVVADRRVSVLRDLGARSVGAKTAEEACAVAAKTLAAHARDIPFALLYLVARDQQTARLAATAGVAPGGGPGPVLALRDAEAGDCPWPLAEVMRTEAPQTVTDLAGRLGGQVPAGPWADPPHTAVVVPIASNRAGVLAGFLVAGISPRLALDGSYLDFLNLVSAQVATSIASAREHEQEKERMDALAEIDRAKTTFFSNLSHEFRTPLTLLLSPLEEALKDGSALSDRSQRERIKTAHSNGLRLLKLVNGLLDFTRVDAGGLTVTPQPTDLAALTENLVAVFRSAFDSAGIELVTEIEPVGMRDVDVDMWEPVVLNLVSNALKYTLRGSVRVALRRRDDGVDFSVADTGIGIARDEQDRVFERFFRSSNEAGRSFEGSGIGLALVSELVRLHGGSIGVQSTPGTGSTFTVTLPARASASPHARDVSSRSPTTRSRAFAADAQRWTEDVATDQEPGHDEAGRPAVLVVDDNSDMRRYLHSLLSAEWRVRLASTGQEALDAARHDRPDVIVSDVMMPGIDGLHLVGRVRADAALRDLPVLLLSGRAGPEATADGLARGANDYLVKPFSASELRARIRALLDASGRTSQAAREAVAGRRRAEEATELSAALHSARNLQAVADAAFAWMRGVLGAHLVTLSIAEPDEPMIRRYFAGTAVPVPTVARYLRTHAAQDTPSARVLRDGIALWFEDSGAQATEDPALARDLKALGLEALAVMPLRLATGLPFAALAVGWGQPVHFDPELKATLRGAEPIVAAAAQRGRFLEAEQSAIQRLESSLLAIDTRATRLIVRARHQGADTGVNVGGDWYDAVDLGDGRVAVAVGDVVGRGLNAVRTAVRLRGGLGLAALGMTDPTETLTALDRYAATMPGAYCTTVALAVADPDRAEVSYACAGHLPPLLVSPAGQVTYLEEGRSWPLGVATRQSRPRPGRAPFPPGSLLLLYTDGLVERRRESLDAGFGRLAEVVAGHWNLPLRRLKQAVFTHLVSDGSEDDVALVAVRSAGAGPDLFCDSFHARREEQRPARQRLRAWLDDTGLPSADRDAVVLAIGEAVCNAIDHGSKGDQTQIVTVELARRGSSLIASVGDRGEWQPGPPAGRGRGHLLMGALAQDIDISLDQGGTVVTLQFTHQEKRSA